MEQQYTFRYRSGGKELKDRMIVTTYVGRNAILPLFACFEICFGFMFGGVLLIENLFLYPESGGILTELSTLGTTP